MNTKGAAVAVLVAVAAAGVAGAFHLRQRRALSQDPMLHVENRFEFTAHGPYKAVFPLFGAFGERAWGGERWQPQFVYPRPARDVEGEVFTVAHSHLTSIWVNTAFDPETGHVQYVYVMPDVQAVRIDIQLKAADAASTVVSVLYERTALHPRWNRHVAELGSHDRGSGPSWQTAIDVWLLKSQPH